MNKFRNVYELTLWILNAALLTFFFSLYCNLWKCEGKLNKFVREKYVCFKSFFIFINYMKLINFEKVNETTYTLLYLNELVIYR